MEGESKGSCIQDIWGPRFVLLLSSVSDSSWCCLWNTLSFGTFKQESCRAARLKPAHKTVKIVIAMRATHAGSSACIHTLTPPSCSRNSSWSLITDRQTALLHPALFSKLSSLPRTAPTNPPLGTPVLSVGVLLAPQLCLERTWKGYRAVESRHVACADE